MSVPTKLPYARLILKKLTTYCSFYYMRNNHVGWQIRQIIIYVLGKYGFFAPHNLITW